MLRGESSELGTKHRHLQAKLRELDNEARNIATAIRHGKLLDALEAQAEAIEKEHTEVKRQLEELNSLTTSTTQVNADDVLRYYQELADTIYQGAPADRKRIAKHFIEEIWVDPKSRRVDAVLLDPAKLGVCVVAPTVSHFNTTNAKSSISSRAKGEVGTRNGWRHDFSAIPQTRLADGTNRAHLFRSGWVSS